MKKITTFLFPSIFLLFITDVIATDLDIFRSYEKNNVMMVIDTSSSMSWPVYDQEMDYGAFMRWMTDNGAAYDENDCRNGLNWWDLDGSGNNYDKLDRDRIYLVSTYVFYEVVQYRDSGGVRRSVSVIDDVMTNMGSETDKTLNKRYGLLANAIIVLNNGKGNPLSVSTPDSIDVDGDNHVLFPKTVNMDIDGNSVTVPEGIKGVRLPNNQDILLSEQTTDPRTGEMIEKGLLGTLKSKGFYFSGVFEKSGQGISLTQDGVSEAEEGYGGKRVYLFATGNWLNFIKLVEDFSVDESLKSCTKEGCFSHQRYKAWQWLCYQEGQETENKACCSEDYSGSRIKSRIQLVKQVLKQVVEQTGQRINFGLMGFNKDSGGTILSPMGSSIEDIVNKIETLEAGGSSPLGEALQDAYNHTASWLNSQASSCALNYILLLTDGFPADDDEWGRINIETRISGNTNPVFGFCDDEYGASCDFYGDSDSWPGNNYSDDVAHFLYHKAVYPHRVMAIDFGFDNPMLAEMADNSSGIHLAVFNQQELANAFLSCSYAVSNSGLFISPVVFLDPLSPTENGEEIYLTFFEPGEDFGWHGNLKKYGLKLMTRGTEDCDRTEPEWVITDRNGNSALDCDGFFKSSAVSLWSNEADGGYVTQGGVGALLKNAIDNVEISSGPYYDFRNIYTCKDPATSLYLERFYRDQDDIVPDTILPEDLGISTGDKKADFLERDRIINLVYGYTDEVTDTGESVYNVKNDGNPIKSRSWILGDIIHSEPVVIDYLDENSKLEYRFIAVGANDGMLHVFAETPDSDKPDATIKINERAYKPGDEIWAFIPGEFLPRLGELKDTQTHKYFVDGSLSLHQASTLNGGYYDKTLVFGQRRGGRSYWALDVSQPDPQKWSIKWRIKGGTGDNDFSPDVGYTWSKPTFGTIQTNSSTMTDVIVFGGGYDMEEDSYPEPWYDGDNNGKYDRDNPEDYFDIHSTSHDANDNDIYDSFNPEQNETGRGIFVVDLSDGSPVFKATFGIGDFSGETQIQADMKWCFPADPTVIELNGNLLIYITDVYGQIWKVSYEYDRSPDKWQVKRIFQANPGSNQPGAQTALSVEPILDINDYGRKAFYSPDVSYLGTSWTDVPVLFFGTGDRAHPKYVPDYHNRFYVISDTDELADETNLINLTCDDLDKYADANQNKSIEYSNADGSDDATIQQGLITILYGETPYPSDNKICRGWYRILGTQGECTQGMMTDHVGEMCLSQPILFNEIVYFTTYQPKFDDPCKSLGNSYIYALDYSTGISVLNFNPIAIPEMISNEGTLANTYQLLEGSGIASGVRVILKGGMAAAYVSGSHGVFSVGEEEGLGKGASSTIPTIEGGTIRLLWEVY